MVMGLVLGTVAKDVKPGNGDKRVGVDGLTIFSAWRSEAVDHEIDHCPAGVGIKAGGMNLGDALLKASERAWQTSWAW